jgi:YidC/Oxa1 family membrane protein insertase
MTDFQNPNQDPGMERRLLLVFAITFIILIAAQPLIMKYMGKKPQPAPAQQTQQQAAPTPAPAAVAAAPAVPSAAPTPAAASKVAQNEEETVVENDLYRITFTNKGGQVKSWILKKYTNDKGQPLDLVNQIAASKLGYPLSLFTYDENLRNQLNSVFYVPSVTGTQTAPTSVTFEYAQGDLSVRKTFSFDHSYVVTADISVTRNGQQVTAMPAWPSGFGDDTVEYSYASQRIDYLPANQDKVIRLSPDRKGEKIGNQHTIMGPFYWAGALDQYFTATFMPERPDQAALVQFRNSVEVPQNLDKPDQKLIKVDVLGAAAGSLSGPTNTRIFVGPKDVDVLAKVQATPLPGQTTAPNIDGLVDFGFFGVIAKPLFAWLKWTHKYVPNWGWAIVVVTVIINLALLPLRISSMKSALKMQKVQPQINAIKKKYEKYSMRDPRRQEMNQEIAAVFKEHGANPVGGCLPMILQMPFLFAFYTMLGVAIELRHAPWLWIKDLSAPDPYYILPIAIVISTLLMQRMTPNPGMDPAQQKMMNLIMPLMLGWISYRLAAGLGVYWVVGTIIAIIQQQVMNRTKLGREMRAEMEKRARKKALKTT